MFDAYLQYASLSCTLLHCTRKCIIVEHILTDIVHVYVLYSTAFVCVMCVICPYPCILYVRVLVFGLMVNYNKSFLDPDMSFVLKVYKDSENSPLSGDCRWQFRFYT